WISFAQQGQPQHRASAADLRSFLQGVFRIGQNIGDLDDASFLQDTTEDRSSPGWDWMLFHERLEFGRKTVKGNLPECIAIRACDADHVRLTQARGGLDQRLEHNFEVERRAAYDLEHFGGGGLLLQGVGKIIGALPKLVEQTCVLDGDDSLGGEVFNQIDLLISEWPYLLAIDREDPDQFIILEHWHVDRGPRTTELDRRAGNTFGSVVRSMTHLLCLHDAGKVATC